MQKIDFLMPYEAFACFYKSGWLEFVSKLRYKRKQIHDGKLLRVGINVSRIWGWFWGHFGGRCSKQIITPWRRRTLNNGVLRNLWGSTLWGSTVSRYRFWSSPSTH